MCESSLRLWVHFWAFFLELVVFLEPVFFLPEPVFFFDPLFFPDPLFLGVVFFFVVAFLTFGSWSIRNLCGDWPSFSTPLSRPFLMAVLKYALKAGPASFWWCSWTQLAMAALDAPFLSFSA